MKPKLTGMRYERRGVLAMHPKAFHEVYFLGASRPENSVQGDAVIVDVRGPLEQHAHPFFDSYEEIGQRVREACATSARSVVLRFDSPGGEAAGLFECARGLREICDTAGKQLHSYIDGDCCSAAYALAASTMSITLGDTALCGSIGVLCQREDYSVANTQNGVRVALIASGARKADGHPDNPITDAELAASQTFVTSMAEVFYQHVAASRGINAQAVAALQAGVFHGSAAMAAGLVDEIGSLTTVLARIAAGGIAGADTMASAYEKAKAALDEASKTEDANGKAAAAALAALVAAEGGGGGDEEKKEGEEQPKKEGEETTTESDPAGDPPAEEEKKAAASAYKAALAARAEVATLRAELAKRDEDKERASLIASRALDAATVALLQKAPMALVREHIASLPASPINPQLSAAPTRGDAQHSIPSMNADEKAALDDRMGITPRVQKMQSTDYKLVLGAAPAANKTN